MTESNQDQQSENEESNNEYIFDKDQSFARRFEQTYVEDTHYSSEEQYKLAVQSLQERYGQPDSAYTPSGKFTVASLIGLIISVPFVFGVAGFVGMVLVWLSEQFDALLLAWFGLEAFLKMYETDGIGDVLSLVSNGAALGIAYVNAVVPAQVVLWSSQRTKNRNLLLAGTFVGGISLILSIFFFWPWLDDGVSVAPTNFYIGGLIPMQWVYVFIGAIVTPCYSIYMINKDLKGQKFCEESQIYLKESFKLHAPIEWVDDVVLSCIGKQYKNLSHNTVNRCADDKCWMHFAL